MTQTYWLPCDMSRERKVATMQRKRVTTIAVLIFMTLIEWATICMSYYTFIPFWWLITNVICVMFNVPLIWWLCSLWLDVRKRENQIRKQYKG